MASKKDIWGFGSNKMKDTGKLIIGAISIIILADVFKNLFKGK
jgi:hypothetical protein